MTTCCATETGEEVFSTESLVFVRSKGGSKFTYVSRDLLYKYADFDSDGT